MPSKGIVILVAMRPELRPLKRRLERPGVELVLTGVGPRRAEAAAQRHLSGARLAITAGCCGGLVSEVRAGTLVVPGELVQLVNGRPQNCPAPDPVWAARAVDHARRLGLDCATGTLVTVDKAVFSADSKRACRERTGAVAVDMETGAVARVAHELGVAHLSLRVVLDALGDLPLDRHAKSTSAALAALGRALSVAAVAVRLRTITVPLAPLLDRLLSDDAGLPG